MLIGLERAIQNSADSRIWVQEAEIGCSKVKLNCVYIINILRISSVNWKKKALVNSAYKLQSPYELSL